MIDKMANSVSEYLTWCSTPLPIETEVAKPENHEVLLRPTVYRGQGNKSWAVLPQIGRPGVTEKIKIEEYWTGKAREGLGKLGLAGPGVPTIEMQIWAKWAIEVKQLSDVYPGPTIENLTKARHHGLLTRITDWSTNPLVALWFACCEANETDGQVTRFQRWLSNGENTEVGNKIFPTITKDEWYYSEVNRQYPRIAAQDSVMLVHADPHEPWGTEDADQIQIPTKRKSWLRDELDLLGINSKVMFPDRPLDEAAAYANMKVTNRWYW